MSDFKLLKTKGRDRDEEIKWTPFKSLIFPTPPAFLAAQLLFYSPYLRAIHK